MTTNGNLTNIVDGQSARTLLQQAARDCVGVLGPKALALDFGEAGLFLNELAPELYAGAGRDEFNGLCRHLMGLLAHATVTVSLPVYLPGDEVRVDSRFGKLVPDVDGYGDARWIVEEVEDDHARLRWAHFPERPAHTAPLGALELVERPIPDDIDDPVSARNAAEVLDTLITVFGLDDNPGALLRAHYVTDEVTRLRWLGALRHVRRVLRRSTPRG